MFDSGESASMMLYTDMLRGEKCYITPLELGNNHNSFDFTHKTPHHHNNNKFNILLLGEGLRFWMKNKEKDRETPLLSITSGRGYNLGLNIYINGEGLTILSYLDSDDDNNISKTIYYYNESVDRCCRKIEKGSGHNNIYSNIYIQGKGLPILSRNNNNHHRFLLYILLVSFWVSCRSGGLRWN